GDGTTGQERCSGGKCQGCFEGAECPGQAACFGGLTGTCSGTVNYFPYACQQGALTPQEAALEFELFDLSACVAPAMSAPPPPPTGLGYFPVTFTEDFTAVCPSGTRVAWRKLNWQASIPSSASIAFSAQTADAPLDGGPPDFTTAQLVPLATATTST